MHAKKKYRFSYATLGICFGVMAVSACQTMTPSAVAQETLEPWRQAQATEIWEPVPKTMPTRHGDVPSDAIVLLSGTDMSAWESMDGNAAKWKAHDGILSVGAGTGDIRTKQSFCDAQYHVEWQSPHQTTGDDGKTLEGQQRGNSGIFLQGRYEVQVLDSHGSKTYPNGQAGSIYKQHIPLVNVTVSPEDWNVYDIIFTAPRFTQAGTLEKTGTVTVIHNGVLIQNHVEIQGATAWIGAPKYEAHECAPLQLQDHGNTVKYRNIWVRGL